MPCLLAVGLSGLFGALAARPFTLLLAIVLGGIARPLRWSHGRKRDVLQRTASATQCRSSEMHVARMGRRKVWAKRWPRMVPPASNPQPSPKKDEVSRVCLAMKPTQSRTPSNFRLTRSYVKMRGSKLHKHQNEMEVRRTQTTGPDNQMQRVRGASLEPTWLRIITYVS